jgi:hypothetical protein
MYYLSWIQIYLPEAESKIPLSFAHSNQPFQHQDTNYVSYAQENEQPPQINSDAMQNPHDAEQRVVTQETTGLDYISRPRSKAESSFRHYGF